MSDSALHIKRLRLRIPGTSKEEGHAFAQQFTDELADRCRDLSSTHIGALHLKIPASNSYSVNPGQIAEAVSSRLATVTQST